MSNKDEDSDYEEFSNDDSSSSSEDDNENDDELEVDQNDEVDEDMDEKDIDNKSDASTDVSFYSERSTDSESEEDGEEEKDEGDDDEEENGNKKVNNISLAIMPANNVLANGSDSDDSDEDDDSMDDENYLKKFSKDVTKSYIEETHPECLIHNQDEVMLLSKVVRNKDGVIIDDLHRTIPFLTKYERARIIGQRAKQIESGSKPFINVPENIVDAFVIAEMELKQKRIPFIIRRPIPGGKFEYWPVKELDQLCY